MTKVKWNNFMKIFKILIYIFFNCPKYQSQTCRKDFIEQLWHHSEDAYICDPGPQNQS